MSEPVLDAVRAGFARSDRVFWLDGGGSRDWSGRRSLVGVLDDDDVSLTFDAARREVTRHQGGRSEVVGDDVFAVLEHEIARDAGDSGRALGRLLRLRLAPGPRRPAVGDRPGRGLDALAGTCGSSTTSPRRPRRRRSRSVARTQRRPDWYRDAFAEVQEQLRAGNSYEVNLTYREQVPAGDPLATYLRLRASNPAPYAGLLSHRGHAPAEQLTGALRDRRPADRWLETKPIKGTTPRGDDRRARTSSGRTSSPPTRSTAPRT